MPYAVQHLLSGPVETAVGRVLVTLELDRPSRRASLRLVGAALTLLAWTALQSPPSPGVVAVVAGAWLLGPPVFSTGRLLFAALAIRATSVSTPSTRWSSWQVDPGTRRAVEEARERSAGEHDLELARIDIDGCACTRYGSLPGFRNIEEEEFSPRKRFDLDIVLRGDRVLVRKDYRRERLALLREATALDRLRDEPVAPRLAEVQILAGKIYKDLLPGPTLNDRLVEAGAVILRRDTEQDSELLELSAAQRIERVWQRARDHLNQVVATNSTTLEHSLALTLDRIHRLGVTGFSLTFGNVLLDPASLRLEFLDFDAARVHRRPSGAWFHTCRDRDRRLANRIYSVDMLSEESARRRFHEMLPTPYAPVDLGRGLTTRGFWSVDSGTGRWEYMNRAVLQELIPGKRVLDLGSHNGILPLMMLRDGARAAVAIERSSDLVETARRLHQILEWRDMRPYDFEVLCTDMRTILEEDWGPFDVVTAFCSLYYLSEEDMRRVLERALEIAPVVVLQAKTDTRADAAEDKALKSSQAYLQNLLYAAGYKDVRIHTKPGYSRPLLIGKRSGARAKAIAV